MGAQGKVMEALNMLRSYKRDAGDLAQVGPLAALAKLEEAFEGGESPTLPRYEMVKGGDLKVGDTVVILCAVTQIGEFITDHVRIRGSGLPRPWNFGEQSLWTWGGEHGSGSDHPPNIMRVTW